MKIKRLLSLILAIVMLLSMAACGTQNGEQNVGNYSGETYDGPAGTLNIVAADFGYGINWIKKLSQIYMAKNKNATIKVEGTVIPHQLLLQIEGGLDKYDLFFGTSTLYKLGQEGVFVNLNDVWSATPNGETATVEEKVGSLASSFNYQGDYYAVPYVLSPQSLVVNDTVMQELYGTNYTLPNTTDEMFALFDEIKTKGVYPWMDSSANYTGALIETWFAQYDSVSYENYYKAQYIDENGNIQTAVNGESLEQPGKLKALQIGAKLLNTKNGYNHQYASSVDFAEAQIIFCGHGYGGLDNKKVAFMSNGAWLENEMEYTLAEYPIEFRMFKTPVISAIIEVVPDKSIANDSELSALITAIDSGSSALSGTGYEVTQKDYDYVKQARSIVNHVSDAHQAGIISSCKSVELAKDFLKFMASDEASSLVMNELGGLTLSYGFVPSEDKTVNCTSFIQSVYDTVADCTYLNRFSTDKVSGIYFTSNPNGYGAMLISGEKTGDDIYNDDYSKLKSDWKFIVSGAQ